MVYSALLADDSARRSKQSKKLSVGYPVWQLLHYSQGMFTQKVFKINPSCFPLKNELLDKIDKGNITNYLLQKLKIPTRLSICTNTFHFCHIKSLFQSSPSNTKKFNIWLTDFVRKHFQVRYSVP